MLILFPPTINIHDIVQAWPYIKLLPKFSKSKHLHCNRFYFVLESVMHSLSWEPLGSKAKLTSMLYTSV